MKKQLLLSALAVISIGSNAKAQITEDFETTPLSGWLFYQSETDDPGFVQTSNQVHGGSFSFYHDDAQIAAASESWMVSPSFACTSNSVLEFWYRQNWTQDFYSYSGVWVSTASNDPITNPSDFSEIVEFDSIAGYSEDVWSRYSEALSAFDGQDIHIAFKYVGDWNHEFFVDDFRLYDFFPQTYFVDRDATGTNDGTSWNDAFTNLNVALDSASNGDKLWVAEGTYHPDRDVNGNETPIDDRSKEFTIDYDVSIYGGFAGTETLLSERNWIINETILSGDIGIIGDSTDNTYTVVNAYNASFILDGFTVEKGNATGASNAPEKERLGGGVFIENSLIHNVSIKNCIIKNHTARAEAGLRCLITGGTTNITVTNTRFTNNVARWASPFVIFTTGGLTNAAFINCLIDNNSSDIINGEDGNTFPGGRFIRYTGGVLNGKLINCTFAKNSENNSTVPDADRSVFGIMGIDNNTEIYNSVFYENNVNTAETSVGFSTNTTYMPNSVTVFNTVSEDVMNTASYITSTNNQQVDPLFTNSANNDFSLSDASSLINGGDTLGISEFLPMTDIVNMNRYYGSAIDLGCYEHQGFASVGDQMNNKTLSVFPNPTSTYLTINPNGLNIETVSVLAISGELIQKYETNGSYIDVSGMNTGVYFLLIQTNLGAYTSKFIKE